MSARPNQSRRNFLRGRKPSAEPPVRPPGALPEAAFLAACTGCMDCVTSCPESIIVRGEGGYPQVDFRRGECTFCGDCEKACDEFAIGDLSSQPWSLEWQVSDQCLAQSGVVCQICQDECPERAIRFPPRLGAVALPVLDQDRCSGCGACVRSCPSTAIELKPARATEQDTVQQSSRKIALG